MYLASGSPIDSASLLQPPFAKIQKINKAAVYHQNSTLLRGPYKLVRYPSQADLPDADLRKAGCGLIAAYALRQALNQPILLKEIKDTAVRYKLWNSEEGIINGPAHGMENGEPMARLFAQLNIPVRWEPGIHWDKVKISLTHGYPAILRLRDHYWIATGFDEATQRYYFGNSVKALPDNYDKTTQRYHIGNAAKIPVSEWMSAEELMALRGNYPVNSYFIDLDPKKD